MKEKFNFHSCWLLVKDQPKWSIGEGSIRKRISSPSENVDGTTKSTSNVKVLLDIDEDTDSYTGCVYSAAKQSSGRPQIQRHAKQERKRDVQQNEIELMNAESFRIQAEAHKQSITCNVMVRLGVIPTRASGSNIWLNVPSRT